MITKCKSWALVYISINNCIFCYARATLWSVSFSASLHLYQWLHKHLPKTFACHYSFFISTLYILLETERREYVTMYCIFIYTKMPYLVSLTWLTITQNNVLESRCWGIFHQPALIKESYITAGIRKSCWNNSADFWIACHLLWKGVRIL